MLKKTVLGPFEEKFLAEYWQKRPLLIRAAFPGGIDAIDPDSLAGLACQDAIDSRLVIEKGLRPWHTQQGPFAESVFETLPKTHWTLLVQAVDRLIPEVSAIRESFQFIPNWRLDDIMISYAADQGSVGPHTDNYDVFLIQAIGRRRWQFGEHALDEPGFIDGLDMKILKEFKADHDFVLEPGDMLYLPPLIAHHGVAQGECVTYSVGFRAPTQNELLVSYSQFLMQSENPDSFYRDPVNELAPINSTLNDPGLIRDQDIESLRKFMIESLKDEQIFRRWIGAFLTEPRNFHEANDAPLDYAGFLQLLRTEKALLKVEGGRFAYHVLDRQVYLAAEGETLVLSEELLKLVQILCAKEYIPTRELLRFEQTAGFAECMLHLWNQGFLRRDYDA
ncbi:MAG: cupin domain-containing protein [Oligoflexus sp.]|nr:cupin domain-containing protein [Oligoflexus sp.]